MNDIIKISDIKSIVELEEVRQRLYRRTINLWNKAVDQYGNLINERAYWLQFKTILLHSFYVETINMANTLFREKDNSFVERCINEAVREILVGRQLKIEDFKIKLINNKNA